MVNHQIIMEVNMTNNLGIVYCHFSSEIPTQNVMKHKYLNLNCNKMALSLIIINYNMF